MKWAVSKLLCFYFWVALCLLLLKYRPFLIVFYLSFNQRFTSLNLYTNCLSTRLYLYFEKKSMRNAKGKSAIYSSILKYGLSDHRLEILEFCERVKAVILAREQYYINLFKPEYNLLQTAGSPLGYKHTEETRAKMSAAKRGQNNFMYGKTHSEETKAKLRLRKHSEETKAKLSAWTRSEETKNKISFASRPRQGALR